MPRWRSHLESSPPEVLKLHSAIAIAVTVGLGQKNKIKTSHPKGEEGRKTRLGRVKLGRRGVQAVAELTTFCDFSLNNSVGTLC